MRPWSAPAAPSPAPIAPATSATIWSRFKTTLPSGRAADASVFALEKVDELGVERPVRRAPELLHARPRERPADRVVGDSAELGGDRACQRLQLLGQRFLAGAPRRRSPCRPGRRCRWRGRCGCLRSAGAGSSCSAQSSSSSATSRIQMLNVEMKMQRAPRTTSASTPTRRRRLALLGLRGGLALVAHAGDLRAGEAGEPHPRGRFTRVKRVYRWRLPRDGDRISTRAERPRNAPRKGERWS